MVVIESDASFGASASEREKKKKTLGVTISNSIPTNFSLGVS